MLYIAQNLSQERYENMYKSQLLIAKGILCDQILPHLGTTEGSFLKKAHYLGGIIKQLLFCHRANDVSEDRDHYGRKRVEMAGSLILNFFKHRFRTNFIGAAQRTIRNYVGRYDENKLINNCHLAFDHRQITDALRLAMATGNWGAKIHGEPLSTGVCQALHRDTSYFATLSHLRRVVAPNLHDSKLAKPRLLHNTHFGYICPS